MSVTILSKNKTDFMPNTSGWQMAGHTCLMGGAPVWFMPWFDENTLLEPMPLYRASKRDVLRWAGSLQRAYFDSNLAKERLKALRERAGRYYLEDKTIKGTEWFVNLYIKFLEDSGGYRVV